MVLTFDKPKLGRKRLTEAQREQAKLKRKEYDKEYYVQHPYSSWDKVSRLLWAAKGRAKIKGVPFELTAEDIVIPTHCPYTGLELIDHVPKGQSRRAVASLDRIIPELGYVKGNVEVISHLANTMKNEASERELVFFATEVLRRHDNRLLRR